MWTRRHAAAGNDARLTPGASVVRGETYPKMDRFQAAEKETSQPLIEEMLVS
jgi:hypothetical protein